MSAELLPNIRSRFCDGNNQPLAGGKLWTYEAGTSTPLATYVDQAAATPNTNPIILDSNGEAVIFITSGVQYKFMLYDANDVLQWSQDNVSGVGFSGNVGTGDVVGPSGSVNNEIALFSGSTGKVLKRASGSGFLKAVAGVISYITGLDLNSDTTGVLPLNRGGSGQTTQNAALNVFLPDQTGNNGKVLKTNGTDATWQSETPQFVSSIGAIGSAPNANGASVSSGVLTLQPADSTYGGVLTAIAQSIAGVKTFINQLIRSGATGITAFAGGGQASATQLSKDINRITTVASAGDSVKLPVGLLGMEVVVINDGANSLNIFPATGESIDSLGANAAYSLTTAAKNARFICAANGVWKTAAAGISGTVPISQGGTGQTTAQAAIDALLPSQTSNSGKFLTTNGTTSSWNNVPTNAPSTFGSTGTPRSIVAATGITSGASHMSNSAITQDVFVVGSVAGSLCDITANPQIEAGTVVGMEMCIHGTSDTAQVQLDDGTGLKLNGSRILSNGSLLTLRWDGSVWREKAWNGV